MKSSVLAVVLSVVPALSLCSPVLAGADAEKPVVTVNDLALTARDLRQELASSQGVSHAPDKGAQGEPEWLARVIERELLVQEAQRQGLDRQSAFMRTIERFWKEALIKHLIDRKQRELADSVRVYEPEIEAFYQKLSREAAGRQIEPYDAVREDLARALRQEKQAAALDAWVNDLRARAHVQIDHETLSTLD